MSQQLQRRKSAMTMPAKPLPGLADALCDRAKVAVLSLDCQKGFFTKQPAAELAIIPQAVQVLTCARQRLLTVIHSGLGYEAGRPEAHFGNLLFRRIMPGKVANSFLLKTDASSNICEALLGLGDIRVYKTRDSAFSGTELDMVLRAKEIRTLVLFGLSDTVVSTALAAYNLDYTVLVVADAVYEEDAEVRSVLLEKLLLRCAIVCSTAAFVDFFKRVDVESLAMSDMSDDEQ
ncbi:Isochorismatase-like protein [Protomyces lactucae-debilis]|uniref:Isochorismatase-like protein n=1 Tax=Protomyces lactucae-debilis TaxID=2754530 RepID=A0A1Y2F6M6_PROLT|nr:Isochorismatase-like protein [Protomyces lactucae-debilis]ORY79533.1 Isochorismatase-like protein [Protomyces lactucae-debilis]